MAGGSTALDAVACGQQMTKTRGGSLHGETLFGRDIGPFSTAHIAPRNATSSLPDGQAVLAEWEADESNNGGQTKPRKGRQGDSSALLLTLEVRTPRRNGRIPTAGLENPSSSFDQREPI